MGYVEVLNEAKFEPGLGWVEAAPSERKAKNLQSAENATSTVKKALDTFKWFSGLPYCPTQLSLTLGSEYHEKTSSFSKTNTHSSLSQCYLAAHPDSSHWAPGSDDSDSPHKAMWVRVKVDKVYSVGGFGDEHRIGYVGKEAWEDAWQAWRDDSIVAS